MKLANITHSREDNGFDSTLPSALIFDASVIPSEAIFLKGDAKRGYKLSISLDSISTDLPMGVDYDMTVYISEHLESLNHFFERLKSREWECILLLETHGDSLGLIIQSQNDSSVRVGATRIECSYFLGDPHRNLLRKRKIRLI